MVDPLISQVREVESGLNKLHENINKLNSVVDSMKGGDNGVSVTHDSTIMKDARDFIVECSKRSTDPYLSTKAHALIKRLR